MKPETFAKDEFIGLQVKIKKCTDPTWTGKKGLIIDETKNTFLIEIKNETKRIGKKTAEFEFEINNEKITINGSKIIYRPEDRIKKIKKW